MSDIEWTTTYAEAIVDGLHLTASRVSWCIYASEASTVVAAKGTGNNHEDCRRKAVAAMATLTPASKAAQLLKSIEALQAEHAALVAKIGGGQ